MDILSITFSEIKHFALDSTGAGMAVIDKWFVGLVLLIAILPILTFTGVTKSKITDFTPVERIAQKSATLYDYPTLPVDKNNSSTKVGNSIATIKKGEAIKLLAYSRYQGCYQVELADGTRGYVAMDVVGDSVLSLRWKKDMAEVGDTFMLKSIQSVYKVVARAKGKTIDDFRVGDFFPVQAMGLPVYNCAAPSPVTVKWVKNNIVKGKTTKEEIDKEWFGYALAQTVKGNVVTSLYLLAVQDAEAGKVYQKFAVTYTDGIVSNIEYSEPEDMGFIMSHLPFVDAIQGNPLCVKYRSESITAPSGYNTISDIKGEKRSAVAEWISENIGDVSMPMWLQYIVVIVGGLIVLALFLLFIHCLLLVLPTLMSFLGYVYVLPNPLYKLLMFLALLFGGELLYVFTGGLPWFVTIMLIGYLYWQWLQWNTWINYNRCPSCHHMYTLNTTNWVDGGKSYYDNVTYNVTTKGGKEISRTETNREHRVVSSVNEHLTCSDCGSTFSLTHTTDRRV